MKKLPYDNTNPYSIETYGKGLIGKTFYEVLEDYFDDEEKLYEMAKKYNNPYSKGSLGNLIEEFYFYYKPNNDPRPDFPEANTELKVTPYEKNKSGDYKAGERLVLTMIPNDRPLETNFYKSELINKLQLILFVLYFRDKDIDRINYKIDYVSLFNLLSSEMKKDLQIIIDDYNKIVGKIIAGKAHELSESDTNYLGACTKGSTAKKSIQPQFYNDKIKAKRRAFSLKQSYMHHVINHYIMNIDEEYQPILDDEDLSNSDFETEVKNKIESYINKTEKELFEIFDVNENSKNSNNSLIMRMLGVNTSNAEEFDKANIVPKTIRVSKNGNPKEHMSFPVFKISDFIQEDFEESKVYNLFSETRFLFVVFQENKLGNFILKGCKFWNMPMMDLEYQGHREWKMYQDKFKSGVKLQPIERNGYIRVLNDLPKASETEIFHVRLHSSNTAYIIDGKKYGKGNENDMDTLPNGNKMTKQSFWLNKSYIKQQINDLID